MHTRVPAHAHPKGEQGMHILKLPGEQSAPSAERPCVTPEPRGPEPGVQGGQACWARAGTSAWWAVSCSPCGEVAMSSVPLHTLTCCCLQVKAWRSQAALVWEAFPLGNALRCSHWPHLPPPSRKEVMVSRHLPRQIHPVTSWRDSVTGRRCPARATLTCAPLLLCTANAL